MNLREGEAEAEVKGRVTREPSWRCWWSPTAKLPMITMRGLFSGWNTIGPMVHVPGSDDDNCMLLALLSVRNASRKRWRTIGGSPRLTWRLRWLTVQRSTWLLSTTSARPWWRASPRTRETHSSVTRESSSATSCQSAPRASLRQPRIASTPSWTAARSKWWSSWRRMPGWN